MQNPFAEIAKILQKQPQILADQIKICKAFQECGKTLDTLNSDVVSWPTLEVDSPTVNSHTDKICLAEYISIYSCFAKLLEPMEEEIEKVQSMRLQVSKARSNLAALQKDRVKHSPQEILEAAKSLKNLLAEQKKTEQNFADVLVHQWRTAIVSLSENTQKLVDASK